MVPRSQVADDLEAAKRVSYRNLPVTEMGQVQSAIDAAHNFSGDEPINLKQVYALLRLAAPQFERASKDLLFLSLAERLAIAKGVTNIDGKYDVKIPGGHFYLYAIYMTDYSLIEWMVPFDFDESGEKSLDLFNESASMILNKSD